MYRRSRGGAVTQAERSANGDDDGDCDDLEAGLRIEKKRASVPGQGADKRGAAQCSAAAADGELAERSRGKAPYRKIDDDDNEDYEGDRRARACRLVFVFCQ
jgi:hypothetical protein